MFVFVVVSALQNMVWICFSAILKNAKIYYSSDEAQIQSLLIASNLVFIPATLVISPLSDR